MNGEEKTSKIVNYFGMIKMAMNLGKETTIRIFYENAYL